MDTSNRARPAHNKKMKMGAAATSSRGALVPDVPVGAGVSLIVVVGLIRHPGRHGATKVHDLRQQAKRSARELLEIYPERTAGEVRSLGRQRQDKGQEQSIVRKEVHPLLERL